METVQQVSGFDISKLYLEAQIRWLKPLEVLFILQNHEKFRITPEPPNKPPSGSLFLFNKRVLRFFRKDGHVWRRKRDGRTIGEAHERLKVGNIDALNCYYAHGEENPNFQRRSYWMLNPAYEHIVLVHYREVSEGRFMTGSFSNTSTSPCFTFNESTSTGNTLIQGTFDLSSYSSGSVEEVNSESLVVNINDNGLVMQERSENSGQPLQLPVNQALKMLESQLSLNNDDCDNDDDGDEDEDKSCSYPTLESMQNSINHGRENATEDLCNDIPSASSCLQHNYYFDRDFGGHDDTKNSLLVQSTGYNQNQQCQPLGSECMVQKKASPFWKEMLELTSINPAEIDKGRSLNPFIPDVYQSSGGRVQVPEKESDAKDKGFYGNDTLLASSGMGNRTFSPYGEPEKSIWQQRNYGGNNEGNMTNSCQDPESNLQLQLSAARSFLLGSDKSFESPLSTKQLQEVEEAVPCYTEKSNCNGDSVVLNRDNSTEWMDNMQLAVENTMYSSNFLETLFDHSHYVEPLGVDLSLTVAQKQLFSIREVSPEWAFSSESTKVIITGDFLCNYLEIEWKVMFGDIEVPVEIVQNGVIRCWAPPHVAGRVSVCVTSGNRESCSEVREFEYRVKPESASSKSSMKRAAKKNSEELLLLTRFAQILLHGIDASSSQKEENNITQNDPSGKMKATDDQWAEVIESLLAGSDDTSGTIYWLLQELLKDQLKQRLSSKIQENVVEVCSLSKQEQSIIHMISGLGFEWALTPILSAGVGVNFRDPNGWTALHWAAQFGREEMVAALLAAGASAGAVTDPTARDPVGKTPASIAASNGHKGLAGYLSEVALTSHLFSLTLEEIEISKGSAELVAESAVESISERSIQVHAGATEDQLSLKDSLAAVRNAAQAAARIQAAFRVHSFRKKQQKAAQAQIHELSVISKHFYGRHDQKLHTAALCIQRRYRGWKGRKNFLNLRQHVVKIQAHVRGHQARKKYKEFLWMVSVFEKAILRWRRRGVGLRGFKVESESIHEIDDGDDDVLKIFRKWKVDAVLDEAVSRVLSMVESPGARQQYRRMLERYQLAKAELDNARQAAGNVQSDCESRDANDDMFHFRLDTGLS